VDDHVPKAHGIGPDFIRMRLAEGIGQSTAGFANDFKMVKDPNLDQFIFAERGPAAP
jgi:hypothetical protein